MYKFSENSSGQFVLKNKNVTLIVTPEKEYTHCDIKVKQMGSNKYSGFSTRSKHEIVKETVKDFVYFRKQNQFLADMYEYLTKGGILHFDGEEVPEDALLVPVHTLDLSTRPHNALERNKIYTIDDIPRTKPALKKLDGMGEKSATEILDKLKEIGLVVSKKKTKPQKRGKKKQAKPPKKKVSANKRTKISETDIPDYIQETLEENDIYYLDEMPKTIKGLLKIKGLGRARIRKLMKTAPIDFKNR